MKRILPILAWAFLNLLVSRLSAQSLQPDFGAPSSPVNVCGGNAVFSVKINGGVAANPDATLDITLPMGYVYVAGTATLSAGTGSVTEVSTSGNTASLHIQNIPIAPGFTQLSYQAYATCAALSNQLTDNSQVSYTFSSALTPPKTTTSNSFNTQSASLSISNITNSSYFGASGDNYTRNINIINNGLAPLTQMTLADTSGPGLSIRGISVSGGWTIVSSKTLSGIDTVTTFTLSGGTLAEGQTVTVVENVTITSNCLLQSHLGTWFGCDGSPCRNNTASGVASAGATVNNSFVPVMKLIPDLLPLTCRGQAFSQTIRVINAGSVKATNFEFNLFSTASDVPAGLQQFNASTASWDQSGFVGFQYKLGVNGNWQSLTPVQSSTFSSPAACLSSANGNVSFNFPLVNPGDTLYISYNETFCPVTTAAVGSITTPGTLVRFDYDAPCGGKTVTTSNLVRTPAHTNIAVSANLPAAMLPGNIYNFNYNFPVATSPTYINTSASGSSIHFEVALPSNVMFSGSASDVTLINQVTGAVLATISTFSYNAATNTITAIYNVRPFFNVASLQNGQLKISNLRGDCSLPAGNNTSTLRVWLRNNTSCTTEEWMLTDVRDVKVICPVPCDVAGGLNFSAFSFRRTNLGQADNDNNGVPDASGVPDPTKIRRAMAMYGDTVRALFSGVVHLGPSSPVAGFTHGYAIDTIHTVPGYYTGMSGSVTLYTAGSSVPFYTVNNLPLVNGTGWSKLDFSLSTLNAALALPGGYTAFNDGDSVVVSIQYKVTGNPGSLVLSVPVTNHFFVSDVTDPSTLSDQYSCNPNFPGSMSLVGYEAGTSGPRSYSSSGTATVTTDMDHYLSIAGRKGGGKPFINEYRPVSIYQQMRYIVPTGSQYVSATASYTYTTGVGTSVTKTVAINPVVAGATPLLFDLQALFTNGTFILGDQGSSMTTSVTVMPTCDVQLKSEADFRMNQVATPGYNTSFPGSFIHVKDSIYYTEPEILVSTANNSPVSTDNTVSWEVQVSNASTAQALRVWMGKLTGIGTVTINSVQRLSGPGGFVLSTVTPNGAGLYQLGNFTQTSNYYKINATYINCTKDSLVLGYWYDCAATGTYPSSASAATYKKTLTLGVTPLISSLQTAIISQPTGTPKPDFCDVLTYEIETNNTGSSAIKNLVVTAGISTGVTYAPGTLQLEYPAGSGSYVPLSDAQVSSSGAQLTFTIPASSIPSLNSQESFRIRFGIKTSCGFNSGESIHFRSSGQAFCGTPIISTMQQGQKIAINGIPTDLNGYTIQSGVQTAIQDCVTGDIYATYHFSITNLGPLPTTIADGFNIALPSAWNMDVASIAYPHDPGGASYTGFTAGAYQFNMGPGIAIGDSVVLTATIRITPPASLSYPVGISGVITENGVVRYGGTCSETGVACPKTEVIVVTHAVTTIPFNGDKTNPPTLTIHDPAAVCAPTSVDLTLPAITAGSSTGLTFGYFTDAAATSVLSNPSNVTVSGTYYIMATSIGGCTITKPVTVAINPLPIANITYPGSPYCHTGTASVLITGQAGGTFSSTSGLVINAVTGDINLVTSANGTYTVIYSFTNGTCNNTATTVVTIQSLPTLVIHDPAPVCEPLTIDLTAPAVTAGSDASLTFSYYTDAAGTITLVNPNAVSVTGTYYVQAVSASGCSIIKAVQVTVNPAPMATINYPGSPYCATGATTATVVMTGQSGGTYSAGPGLSINASTGTVNISTSTPGTYTVTYTFSNGSCPGTTTTSFIITAPPVVIITNPAPVCAPAAVDLTDASVTAGSDAGLTFTYYTDAAGTIVLINPNAVAVSGTYYIVGESATGCKSLPKPVVVTIRPLPVATISYPGSPYCKTGSANVVITGQAGGTFTSTTGLSIDAATGTVNLGSSTAATYTVTYTFSNGTCTNTTTTSITINEVPLLVINDPAQVCMPATVDITLPAVTAGSEAGLTLTYYSDAAGTIVLTNPTAINTTGTYYIAAVNAAGCRVVLPVHVIIAPLPVATIAYNGSPFCHNGTATPVITGQAGGTFSSTTGLVINSTTGVVDLTASTPGNYVVTYSFSNASCSASATTSITIEATPVLVISDPAPVCAPASVNLASAAVTAGSTPGLTYQYYSDAAGIITLANPASVSTTGTYYIQGTSAGGCLTALMPVNVVINPLPIATISYPGSPYCQAVATPVTVNQTGQAGGTYSAGAGLIIDATTGTITIAASTPGTYTINYHFTNGTCENDATTTITIEPTPVLAVNDPAAVCEPMTVNLVAAGVTAGSTAGLSFSYYTDAAGTVVLSNPSAVSATGTYYIQGVSPAGCLTSILAVNVTVNPMPVATITYPSSPICYTPTGIMSVVQTGQTGGTYTSTAGLNIDSTTGEINLAGTTPGVYNVTYHYTNGLCDNTATAQVFIEPKPVLTIKNPAPACIPNTVDLTASGVKQGSTAGLVYSYYNDAAGTDPLTNPSTVAVTGTYYIQGMNPATGCLTDIVPVDVVVSDKPVITANAAPLVCKGEETLLIASSAGNAITWPGLGVSGDTAIVYPQGNGTYTAIATNAAGCTSAASVTVDVRNFDVTLTASANPVMPGTPVTLSSGANDTYTVTAWTPTAEFPGQTNVSQTFVIVKDEMYTVVGRSADGCMDTASILINIKATDTDFYIPNAFSPNNDGKNDLFMIYGSAIKNIELRVFNQWGELLYETYDKSKGWDGTFKGRMQPVGPYPFGVKVTFLDGKVISKRGSVNLIR